MSANKYPLKFYIGVEEAKARIGLQVETWHDGLFGTFAGLELDEKNDPLIVLSGERHPTRWIRFADGKFYDARHARPLNWLIEVLTPELRKKPEPKKAGAA